MNAKSRRDLSQALIFSFSLALLAALAAFSGLIPGLDGSADDEAFGAPELGYETAAFADIDGWAVDNQFEAAGAFARSCARIDGEDINAPANPKEALGADFEGASLSGRVIDWDRACAEAAALLAVGFSNPADAAAAARSFFEAEFTPLRILSKRRPEADGPARGRRPRLSRAGLATGYFEPVYDAAPEATSARPAPLLAKPDDLVMVDLGEFREKFAGERIAGAVLDGQLTPYPDHKAINAGALGDRARPLAFLDPNDLFFLQIQGSGRLRLEGGEEIRVGYDGQNGQPYAAIGRILIERGALTRENVSMQTIRAWLAQAGAPEARALREANPSYVFFRRLDDLPDPELGPLGSEGVQLTPMRSVAVDRRFYAMGAPIWIKAAADDEGGPPQVERLFIAQDEGGAVKGPLRADIFVGAGAKAGEIAGEMKAGAEMFVLVPKPVAARLVAAKGRAR